MSGSVSVYQNELRRIGLILLIAAAPAAASAWWHGVHRPEPPPAVRADPSVVSPEQVVQWLGEGGEGRETVLWLDARPASDYQAGHVEGALPLTQDAWEEQLFPVLERWHPGAGMRVVVYCGGNGCNASRAVADRLREAFGGEARVYVLRGG